MVSFFISKGKFGASIAMAIIMILSIVYMCVFNQSNIFDIFSVNNQINKFENIEESIPPNEVNKWRNKFKHPLVLPSINLIPSERPENNEVAESAIDLKLNNTDQSRPQSNVLNFELTFK